MVYKLTHFLKKILFVCLRGEEQRDRTSSRCYLRPWDHDRRWNQELTLNWLNHSCTLLSHFLKKHPLKSVVFNKSSKILVLKQTQQSFVIHLTCIVEKHPSFPNHNNAITTVTHRKTISIELTLWLGRQNYKVLHCMWITEQRLHSSPF